MVTEPRLWAEKPACGSSLLLLVTLTSKSKRKPSEMAAETLPCCSSLSQRSFTALLSLLAIELLLQAK